MPAQPNPRPDAGGFCGVWEKRGRGTLAAHLSACAMCIRPALQSAARRGRPRAPSPPLPGCCARLQQDSSRPPRPSWQHHTLAESGLLSEPQAKGSSRAS